MAHFIQDIRKDLGVKDLLFVIANTGMGGWTIPESARYKQRAEKLMNDQLALADPKKHPEFAGTAAGVETRDLERPVAQSPTKQGFHWSGNWETHYLIGEAMGVQMIQLVKVGP